MAEQKNMALRPINRKSKEETKEAILSSLSVIDDELVYGEEEDNSSYDDEKSSKTHSTHSSSDS